MHIPIVMIPSKRFEFLPTLYQQSLYGLFLRMERQWIRMQRLDWSSTRKFPDLKALVASAKVGTIPVNGFARQLVRVAAIRLGVFSISEFKRTCGPLVRI